ncbi:hypothetical protein DHEL01_v202873 [Diaporthe helianthi]|uniref:SRm160/300 splicing coactivator n=1 Tax=Diaporthe helianthi TaxID=158607 RepID=A0A2P5I897_DIAHE|nr:hypothetical protein DHEL01_v202873 [Diaporthe helianthi]
MAPAKPSTDEASRDKDKQPSTPRRASAARNPSPGIKRSGNNGVATPLNRRNSNQTPKSAPAATGAGGVRKSSVKKTVEPTLLGDFLLGRPSAARVAAAKRKSLDSAAVRAELHQQMRQDAVRRVQQPGKVQARVKAWQKANAAAMVQGNPDEAASEPTEVAIHVDADSVTEEDRVRIKSRQKPRRKSATSPKASPLAKVENRKETPAEPKEKAEPKEAIADDPRIKAPPKKRIVSDEHWMKRNSGNSIPKAAAAGAKPGATVGLSPSPIPKDFLQRTAAPANKQNKIKAWASKVELPASPEPPEIPKVEIPKASKPTLRYNTRCGETITVEEAASGVSSTVKTRSSKAEDDGIRVKPMRSASPRGGGDDGIRVRPLKTAPPLPDDGIRVRPIESDAASALSASSRTVYKEKRARVPSTRRDRSPSARIEVIEEPETDIENTPRRKSKSRVPPRRLRSASGPAPTVTETATTKTGSLSEDDRSWTSEDSASQDDSERPSSAPAKSLAEVPFGYSAFSELELPVGADHHHIRRPKAQRTSSFKAVPKAFKKIVTGAKEIVHERVDPPKPVTNQPPSIESWLNGTVDPFVDKSAPQTTSLEKPAEEPARRKASMELPAKKEAVTASAQKQDPEDSSRLADDDDQTEVPEKPAEPRFSPSAGLKRSKATRAGSSTLKPSPIKRPLRETLNNLFRGQSSGHKLPPKAYSSYQDMGPESELSYMDEVDGNNAQTGQDSRQYPAEDRRRSPSPESSYLSTDVSSNTEGPYMTPAIPRRRPPPTSGLHELSTIASEESGSTVGSETMSMLSETTVTQTTGLTRSTGNSRRSKGSGLKRRLTKHSDLVSVLSLPDDDGAPMRNRSLRSTSSLRRRTSRLGRGTVDDLLREFAVDEDFYQRELKTLVDGAIPVLLNQVVQGRQDYATDLFGPSTTDEQADSVGKTVVNMGIALEKLRNLHKWAPLHDVNKTLNWLLTAYPVYDKYLDVWRLGFEGIVVNLAPAPGRADDEDSLVNAMPRNEDGDVVDTKGQPVDLQHLLTRPVTRIRGLLKLLKSAEASGNQHPDLPAVIDDFSALQEKARRRHREEVARKTDEDANNTDTSRCCDLRKLNLMDRILIDPSRQVNAKDYFSLELAHSSGQRLECQVELIYRDKPKDPLDRGDILIRDVGHAKCCLMFPPIPKTAISARRGEEPGALVVMVRGRHNGKEWFELLTLYTDLEDQVLDWLEILGTNPLPPAASRPLTEEDIQLNSSRSDVSVPLGERSSTGSSRRRKSHDPRLATSQALNETEDQSKSKTPSRHHTRHVSSPTTPTTPTSTTSNPLGTDSPERTPTRNSLPTTPRPQSLPTTPLREDMRPEPRKLTKSPPNNKPFREDGAPPPPVHRTFSSEKSPALGPPVDLNPAPSSRIRRRGSSPLKHEYRPSDVSSDSSETESDSASEVESSGDEIDEADVPDTQPAISIKQEPEITGAETVISDNSIAPSQSASQVGLYGRLGPGGAKDPEYIVKAIATISYWSNKKGQWTEALAEPCSINITPGLIEAYPLASHAISGPGALNSSGSSELNVSDPARTQPLIALELTPIVMIRRSTALDLEVRSPVRPYCKLSQIDAKIFRFRALSGNEGTDLYQAVHKARLNNAKYRALEEESRFRNFGQPQAAQQGPESQSSGSNRRGLFGRKNSYRASTRAPSQSLSQSQGTSSSISAPSLLKRLTGTGNISFNINKSYVDRHSRPNSAMGGAGSLYTSSSSSADGMSTPRSPSVSLAETGRTQVLGSDNLRIRCHLLVTSSKWEDHGNCNLQITRPPPGMRQELRIKHGMEKRVIVTRIPKKKFGFGSSNSDKDKPMIVLDVVLGSKCFSRLGSRGIILNVWEEMRDEENNIGLAPKTGGLSGKVTKWCFQCSSAMEASWIFGLVAQEVNIGLGEPLLPEGPMW